MNLAIALSQAGALVGILDGDIYGPNIPLMLGLRAELASDGRQIRPAEKFGLQVVSIGFMTGDDQEVIWRGPMVHGAIQQFVRDVGWRDLEYLIIDMPPGTGDVALSLSQTVPVAAPWLLRPHNRYRWPTVVGRCGCIKSSTSRHWGSSRT